MPKTTESPVVIRLFYAEGCNAAEIHRRMSNVCGETFMSDSKVRQWLRNFQTGRTGSKLKRNSLRILLRRYKLKF